MAEWKKLILSGSAAELASLSLDTALTVANGGTGLTSIGSDNFLVGNGATSFTTVGSNGTGTVVRTTGAVVVGMTGSFSGSFQGDGSQLTGLSADSTFTISAANGSSGDFNTATDTLNFTTASDHGFSFSVTDANPFLVNLITPQGLSTTDSPTFEGLTANGNVTLGNASGDAVTVDGQTFTFTNSLPAGTDNTVVILNSSNELVTDEIDPRVWGTSLIDGSGASTRVAYFSDGDTLTSNASFTFDGTDLTVGTSTFGTNTTIAGDLTVLGDTFQQQVTNLLVEDRFVLLNSGSATGDGGIIIQTEADFSGSAFGWDDSATRFGFQLGTTKLGSSATTMVTDAYVAAVVDVDGGLTDVAAHQQNGNIKIDGGEIFIYA